MKWFKSLVAVGIALLTMWPILAPLPALAQSPSDGLNLQISPLPIVLSATPGTTTHAELRVRNAGSSPQQLKVVLKTFKAEGSSGRVTLHDPTPADDYLNWVSFDRTSFSAPAGEWQAVQMTVQIPASAAFGYYWAVQFEQANPPKPTPGTTGVRGAVAIFVLLNAEAPGAVKKIEVSNFSTDHKSYEFLPANFAITVHNSGNVHTAPHGNIFIKRGSKQIATLDVNPTEGLVLPKSNRQFSTTWNDGFPHYEIKLDAAGQPVLDQKGQPEKSLKWDFSKVNHLRFGHYTADLLLIYNDGQRDIPITGTLSFWVIPWRLVGGVVIVLIFMMIGFWSSFKKTGRFISRQSQKVKRP